jgi:hypothetical protein
VTRTSAAYSCLRQGQYTAFNSIQGRRSGNLRFAGEHTSVDFQGIRLLPVELVVVVVRVF